MTWEEVKELAPLYAIGALDSRAVQEVDDVLRWATCEQRREFAEWVEVATTLPLALPTQIPSPDLKAQLMERIADSQPAEESSAHILSFRSKRRFSFQSQRQTQQWAMAAASVLLIFTSAYLFWQNYKMSRQLTNSDLQVSQLRHQLDEVLSPATRILAMHGVEVPNATAKIIWNLNQQTWEVHINNLPAPSSDKDYQLWYVTKDAKLNAAVFSTNANGNRELKLTLPAEAIQGLAATAVTLEPKGGSPQPTGKFYLLAQI